MHKSNLTLRTGLLALLISLTSAHATQVMFPLKSFFYGANYSKGITITAVNSYLTDGTNISAGSFTTLTPSGGTNPIIDLVPNDYTLTFADVRKPLRFGVYDTNVVVNVLTLITNGLSTYNFVAAGSAILLTNADGSVTVSNSGQYTFLSSPTTNAASLVGNLPIGTLTNILPGLVIPPIFSNTPARIATATFTNTISLVSTTAINQADNIVDLFAQSQLTVSGDILGVVSHTNFSLISLTNKLLPKLVGQVQVFGANANKLPTHLTHKDSIFYILGDGFIKVYNCAVPAAPVLCTNILDSSFACSKGNVKDGLLIVSGNKGTNGFFRLFSLANPALPLLISETETGGNTQDTLKIGNLLYVGANAAKLLRIYDIEDVLRPRLISSIGMNTNSDANFEPWRLMTRDNVLYICDDTILQVWSLNNRTNPVQITERTNAWGGDIEGGRLQGDYLVWAAANGVIGAFDVSEPMNPTLITTNSFDAGNEVTWYSFIAADENFIYTSYFRSLRVISMPKIPTFGTANTLLVGITNTVRFPIASNNAARALTVKVTANVTNVLSTIGSDTIDSASTLSLTNKQARTFQSDGRANWIPISGYNPP